MSPAGTRGLTWAFGGEGNTCHPVTGLFIMDRGAFWGIINPIALAPPPRLPPDDHYAKFIQRLTDALATLPTESLESFQDNLQLVVAAAYTSELYGVHCLVNGGGSLDGFYYFRAWLVAQGRPTYDAALQEPDSLSTICTLRGVVADYECEDVLNVAKTIYSSKTGQDMSWRADPGDLNDHPMPGRAWQDDAELRAMLPRLAAIHMT